MVQEFEWYVVAYLHVPKSIDFCIINREGWILLLGVFPRQEKKFIFLSFIYMGNFFFTVGYRLAQPRCKIEHTIFKPVTQRTV